MASAQGIIDFEEVTRIQDRAIGETRPHMLPGKAVLIEAPTGAGKTRINSINIANFAEDFRAEHGRDPVILALQHREALLVQNQAALAQWAPNAGLTTSISLDGDFDPSGNVNYATVQTAAARLPELGPIDLLTIDEAHHASDSQGADYSKVIEAAYASNPNMVLLTTTATPTRPDRKGLHPRLSDAKRVTIGYKELERAGQIRLPRTKAVNIRTAEGGTTTSIMRSKYKPDKEADPAGLTKALRAARPADFNDQMLDAWELGFKDSMDRAGIHAGTIVYEGTIASARKFAADAASRGHRVAVMDSDQSKDDNRKSLADYTAGGIDLLVSVKMIDEGIDVPHTRSVIINRETTSPTEYHQMVGRSMRTGSDPALQTITPIVFDGGASTMIHGAVERRAEVIDYLQRLDRGEISAERNEDAKWMPKFSGEEYSPWHIQKDPPPVMALTDGLSNIYAVVSRTADGDARYTLSEAKEVKGRSQVTIMKGEDGKPLFNVDGARLYQIMSERLLARREEVLRLEATDSLKSPGKSLADDRFMPEHVNSAVLFAATLRQGAGR